MAKIYIAEKPSQGRALRDALGPGKPGAGGLPALSKPPGTVYWLKDGACICALGHLLRLKNPHEYNPDLKKWDLDTLPMIPEQWGKIPNTFQSGVAARLSVMKKLLNSPKVTEIIIATDAGREGELIAREILEWAVPKSKMPKITRVWAQSMSSQALQKAFKNRKDGSTTEGLGNSGKMRERWDWLIGLNFTRLFTIKCKSWGTTGVASVGRVQTPTLAMVVRQERKILDFVATDYFEIEALAKIHGITLRFAPAKRILQKSEAEKIAQNTEGFQGKLSVKKEAKKQAPPPLFDLANLQKAASSAKGWTAKKTLDTAQNLYEAAAISYPRTDCVALDPQDKADCIDLVIRLGKECLEYKGKIPAKKDLTIRSKVFSASQVAKSDHHAIIPTEDIPKKFASADEKWLWNTVARRFASQFLPDREYLQTTISMDANGNIFSATGAQTTKAGWKSIYTDEHTGDVEFPDVKDGAKDTLEDLKVIACKTKPPNRFTEGSLVQAMKKAGIGTQATWAAIIELLKNRKFIESKKGKLIPYELGMKFIEAIEQSIPEMAEIEKTAELEVMLDDLVQKKTSLPKTMTQVITSLKQDTAHLKKTKLPQLPFPQGDTTKFSRTKKTKK